MPLDLTEKQIEFLSYLRDELASQGRTPSLRTAATRFGVSHAAILDLLHTLEEKGYVKREGRYSRNLYILNRAREVSAAQRSREIPIIGRIAAGLPMYAQEEWDGSIIVDGEVYRGQNLFALRVKGDSMVNAGILEGDLVICEPRQYADNGEVVVALVRFEEATVKRFYKRGKIIELRPENPRHPVQKYDLGDVLVQGKVIGVQRGPNQARKL